MAKNLLIVESPSKAKTIEKYLGKDFKVKSSYGHIRDLSKGKSGIDIEQNYTPNYEVPAEKKKVVSELKTAVKSASEVWLATDEDREGEAISWHLCKVLGLDENTTKRIVFREITKSAIRSAIENPRTVDLNLVNAQQARRILDRLVGFELSELLWRKVKGKLSAGRVQSVAVRLIVEREREILDFTPTGFYKVVAIFNVLNSNGKNVELKANLSQNYETKQEAEDFLKKCIGAQYKINDIQVKPTKRKPAAPFTTSTLQQEASRKIYFSVNRTMRTAQRLYEAGYITYMRTDSISLSKEAVQNISKRVVDAFGDEYLQPREYSNKSKNAQEAHEAIRPTDFSRREIEGTQDMQKLYDLVWKRTMASQMADARLEKTDVKIGISTTSEVNFKASGEVLKFDGFLKLYQESKDGDEDEDTKGILPPLKVGQILDLDHINAVERFTKPPARYTEASLVKKLEELGIGRPSTYAPTVTKIMEEGRGYVTKESREGVQREYESMTLTNGSISSETKTETTGATSNRLYASDIGMVVTDFLKQHFSEIMDYGFTADIENKFDKIALGSDEWQQVIDSFYVGFHDTVQDTLDNAERANGARILGKEPESGRTMTVQISRYGPVIRVGADDELGEDEKPKFASLQPGQSMETIQLAEALDLFKLPKEVGEYQSKPVVIGLGRFGPYVKYDEAFISIPRGEDPLELSLDRAIELIKEKQKADAPIYLYDGKPVTKGKGRFGPFIKWNEMFINVNKKYDFDNLSDADIVQLVEAKIEKEANRYIKVWDKEKIAIENGRWGPFIRFKRKSVKLPKVNGEKMTAEELKEMSLEDVKKLIEAELPGSFKEKKKAAKKKPAAKKKTTAKK